MSDAREWTIEVCSECGALTEDGRDYGGPYPKGDCPTERKCGTFTQSGHGPITCPGTENVSVVEVV